MAIYVTSDNHFCHKNIIKYENRPFSDINEMTEIMIKLWNKTVSNTDSIYILGDFAFADGFTVNQILKRLNGKKYLIRGNHDYSFLNDKNFDKPNFEWIKDYYVLEYNKLKFVLFHYPIQTWNCQHYGAIHLYGHIHSNKGNHPMKYEIPNSYNVGVDVNGYKPILLDDIAKKLKLE
jgi:calcineurin-like phosphoesterase family protein